MANDRSVRTYGGKFISITFGAIIMTGFVDGDFLAITGEDVFVAREGADGSEDRVNTSKTGRDVDVTLMKTSITNDVLSTAFEIDINTNQGKQPFLAKDLNGTMSMFSEQAYIKKKVDVTLGDGAPAVTWNFRCPQTVFNPGSNL